MALSILSQQSSFWDLQTFFDPFPTQQQQQHYQHHKIDSNCSNNDQMEYNNHSAYQQHNSPPNLNNTDTGIINQTLNRNFLSDYHSPAIGTDYEQVVTFVDSPPISEESWTDEQSKGSPGAQIIDVQTIYSNSGSRKRRMDWDSLNIGSNGNATSAQSSELTSKILQHEKDKQKREKLSGRGSWTEDIGFDLNAEFNSSNYLNNEQFLSFSPSLTALKQEPHTEQLKGSSNDDIKGSLQPQAQAAAAISVSGAGGAANVKKLDASPSPVVVALNAAQASKVSKNDLNSLPCGCGSPPQSSQQGYETNVVNVKKLASAEKCSNPCNAAGMQQLIVLEAGASKIEDTNANVTSHSDDHKFQYILAAATSIATKNNEETLTYLNQGQSYEIKLKKIGDLSYYRDKVLKSVIKICFHERRLQFMEREQMQQWQASRPGERIIEVDVPLSYGLCHVSQPLNSNCLHTVEVFWDPLKEVGVYIKVNCISTEFTPKKHGGEKGVPFRLQIETYIENTNSAAIATGAVVAAAVAASQSPISVSAAASPGHGTLPAAKQPVHAAACQIKVFKLKGADRKHKQDREKIQKRPQSEQEKFQPSYECTIMNDLNLDSNASSGNGPGCYSPPGSEYMKTWPNSPVHIPKYDGVLQYTNASPAAASSSPIAINSVTSTNSPSIKLMDANMVSPQQVMTPEVDDYAQIMPESTPAQVTQWLNQNRLSAYLSTFAHFSGSDIMRLSKEDFIQICGLADGIRIFNILRAKAITPRLTIYVSLDGSSYNAIYLISSTAKELAQKLFKLPGFYELIANSATAATGMVENGGGGSYCSSYNGMHSKYSGSGSNVCGDTNKSFVYVSGPAGVIVTVTDEVLNNEIKDGSLYGLEVQNGKVLMKSLNKNDN